MLWYLVNIRTLVHSKWIWLLEKLIVTSLSQVEKLNFEENINTYKFTINRLIFMVGQVGVNSNW